MDQSKEIERLIGPAIDQLGYELVRIQLQGSQRVTLQIMAERHDRQPMKVEDCAHISRAISTRLDEADPIASDYLLEVSSPGIDRPLMKLADYERFAGHDAKLELNVAAAGRKRLQGVIIGIEGENILVALDADKISVPLDTIRQAKLILTDRLIDAAQNEMAVFLEEADTAPHIHV